MRCPKCNFPVLPKFDKCPKCGTPLKQESAAPTADFDFDAPAKPKVVNKPSNDFDFDAPLEKKQMPKVEKPVDGLSIISGKVVWSLGVGQIARRITEREMADCGAVKGVVVQDGVTAAVFSDGKLVETFDGGIYRFSDEIVRRNGKIEVITPENEVKTADESPEEKVQKKRGFFSRLFGLKKEEPNNTQSAVEKNTPKPATPNPKAELAQKNSAVTVVYLISNRVFEESFGSAGSVDYKPFEVNANGTPLKVGVSMQMRVTDFETFRRQYLVDSNEVSIESLRRLISPWVKQIVEHVMADVSVTGGRLSPSQQSSLKQVVGTMLQSRLFGISIIDVFDIATRDEEFEYLSKKQRELSLAQKENDQYIRETEFRNRLADFEMQQEAARLVKDNDNSIDREKEYSRFELAIAELNRDKLLSEDELKQFIAQHEMELRLADAARNADEQTRRYESEKLLNDLESRKLIDADDRKAIEERIAQGQFERGQLNDMLRHKLLVENTSEKLRLDTELAIKKDNAAHQQDINSLKNENERTDLENILYGKRYEQDRLKVAQELELKSIRLDADIETRRKEDAYAEEKYQLERSHEHDAWEEQFMREGKALERKREERKADADFDFDNRKRNEEFDFDLNARKADFDFDLESRRQEKDFDLESRRRDKEFDIEAKKASLDFDLENKRADSQHARDMEMRRQQQEELRLKGNIAMENMKAMMEAKRAARKDELDAETDKLNIKSQMTAEQLAAEQLAQLDISAQAGFMDALKEKSSSAKEAEMARKEAEMTRQMHEQMMDKADSLHEQNRNDMKEMMAQMMQMQQMSQQQAMDLARHSMDTSANIAGSQAAANASAAERRVADLERDNDRYREDARHSQQRLDSNQSQSLDYTTRVTQTAIENDVPAAATAPTAAQTQSLREEIATVPLNTAWLREHGFSGSFNELAGQLSSLGGEISKDYDADGNPIIIVDGLPEGRVFDILQHFGVTF